MTKSRTTPMSHATYIAERRIRSARAHQAHALRSRIAESFGTLLSAIDKR